MPYSNGDPTGDEHAQKARIYLDGANNEPSDGSHSDLTAALIGMGKALLAIDDRLSSIQANQR